MDSTRISRQELNMMSTLNRGNTRYQNSGAGVQSLLGNIGNSLNPKAQAALAKSGNAASTIAEPDWDEYLTKRKPAMTDAKYAEAIKEQARKDKEAGVYQEGDAFNKLKLGYVSVVSPDRKAIVDAANKSSDETGSTGLFASRFSQGQYKDEDGKLVAMYGSRFGWMILNTEAENKRSTEFLEIYNSEYFSDDAGKEAVEKKTGIDVEA